MWCNDTRCQELPRPEGYAPILVPELSRRAFLKLLGFASFPLIASLPRTVPSTSSRSLQDSDNNRGQVGYVQALMARALAELRRAGFAFDLTQSSVVQVHQHPFLLGLLLQDIGLPPHREGADLALTMDLRAPRAAMLTYIVGRSNESALSVHLVSLGIGDWQVEARQQFPRQANAVHAAPLPVPAHTSAYRRSSPEQSGLERVATHTYCERTPWYYYHAGGASWRSLPGPQGEPRMQLRLTTCQELRSSRIRSAHALGNLRQYNEQHSVVLL